MSARDAFAIFEHACTVVVLTVGFAYACGLISFGASFGAPKE